MSKSIQIASTVCANNSWGLCGQTQGRKCAFRPLSSWQIAGGCGEELGEWDATTELSREEWIGLFDSFSLCEPLGHFGTLSEFVSVTTVRIPPHVESFVHILLGTLFAGRKRRRSRWNAAHDIRCLKSNLSQPSPKVRRSQDTPNACDSNLHFGTVLTEEFAPVPYGTMARS